MVVRVDMGCGAAAVCGRWGRCRSSRRAAFVARVGSGTGSGCRPESRALAFEGEERVCERDEGDVVVPAVEAAAFEVVEAERVFEFAVVVLDAPSQLREAHELLERRVSGEVGEPILDGLVAACGPFGEQPAFGQLAIGLCGGAAQPRVRGTDPEREEARAHRPARSFAPAHLDRRGQTGAQRELTQRAGLGAVAWRRRATGSL